ncbi:hypothetical protein SLEP1_g8526 [Rubroshorea leprosula]|uniref:Uncharacterized protein n=1 Tax=Rubroshorea leprosula TaxID=152421 RepID=A0AAV5I6H7_9ROSI|nr:hypothetical protein SLEP1_g8526 [Rubroshorea leprosula]
MAGPVFGFHPHSFCDPSDHCVVPLGTQKAALPGSGPLVFRFKVPPTFNIANVEAPVNVHAPRTTDGKGKDVDAIASGSSYMAAHSVRNTDIIPVLSTQKPNIADEVAVPVMPVERKRHQIIRLKVAAPKNTTTEAAVKKDQEQAKTLKSTGSVMIGKVGSTAVNNKATSNSSPNGKVVHQDRKIGEPMKSTPEGLKNKPSVAENKFEDKFEASKRKLVEQYKGIQESRKKIRVIELKDLPKQQGTRSDAPAPLTKKRMMKTKYSGR